MGESAVLPALSVVTTILRKYALLPTVFTNKIRLLKNLLRTDSIKATVVDVLNLLKLSHPHITLLV